MRIPLRWMAHISPDLAPAEALGYTLMLPASASTRRSVEIPLPLAPVWNKGYGWQCSRLVRFPAGKSVRSRRPSISSG